MAAVALVLLAALGAACGGTGSTTSAPGSHVLQVVAAENFWGSIAAQLGGARVNVTSIISNPATDPHAYEPTPADARLMAGADVVIVNGVGYDPWATKLLAADPRKKTVLDVGLITGVPAGGNPHRWYNPADVHTVIDKIVAAYSQADAADAGLFQAQRTQFDTVALKDYNDLIATLRARYSGTPVGASESIFSMLAPSLGLDLITPYSFLRAITEGSDVASADKKTIDDQISRHLIKIYVYNSQNTTPDVQAQLSECQASGIPTATITETLVPPTATFQDWQARELRGIQAALAQATGR